MGHPVARGKNGVIYTTPRYAATTDGTKYVSGGIGANTDT